MQLTRRSFLPLAVSGLVASSRALARSPELEEVIDALKAELAARTANDTFAGTVLIAQNHRPIFHAACGLADREKSIPHTLNTKLIFGSMGKMFTSVSIMQLVESGRVRLDDPLGNYLPDYPSSDVAAVTIHQLLTHTGGTGDIFGPAFDEHRLELRTLQDYVDLYGKRGLVAPVGTFNYSNYGYILLGCIIERVSRQSYYDYVHRHVFAPTGMRSTGNLPATWHVADLAIPYSRMNESGTLQSVQGTLPYRGTSAGGGYSTVGDFLKFARALTSYRLLSAHSTELLLGGKVNTPGPAVYAYGFEQFVRPDGVRFFGHGGAAPGINGGLDVYPDSGYVVTVLANLDGPAAREILSFVGRHFPVG